MSSALRSPAATLYAIVLLCGCHRVPQAQEAKSADPGLPAAHGTVTPEDHADSPSVGVTLTADEAARIGVVTEPAKSIDYVAEIAGFGMVIPHDGIASAVAELTTAQAGARQSRAALERAQRLTGTAGAMSADAGDGAARQSATDDAALVLAEQRLSTVIGAGFPGGVAANGPLLHELAAGKTQLVRATFPLGSLPRWLPASLRVSHLDALTSTANDPAPAWSLQRVWRAPADPMLPGRSFFALSSGAEGSEGERLLVSAPSGVPTQQGVAVPASALVLSDGKSWCYVETRPGIYVRREIDVDRPVADGFFVSKGIAAGDPVVTAAAGLLLARETNRGIPAD